MSGLLYLVGGVLVTFFAIILDNFLVQKNWDKPWARLAPVVFYGLGLLAMFLVSSVAKAQSHSYANYMRSSTVPHVYFQQGISGEYSLMDSGLEKSPWRGYGIDTTIALETMKFVQFKAGHTFVVVRSRDDATEGLNGSRLHAGLGLSFLSPIANLEIGSGVIGSSLDYQNKDVSASYHGSGIYYSIGLNHHLTSKISIFGEAKSLEENLVKTVGAKEADGLQSKSRTMGMGFRIWL